MQNEYIGHIFAIFAPFLFCDLSFTICSLDFEDQKSLFIDKNEFLFLLLHLYI